MQGVLVGGFRVFFWGFCIKALRLEGFALQNPVLTMNPDPEVQNEYYRGLNN